jgi:hypothetical protein
VTKITSNDSTEEERRARCKMALTIPDKDVT